MKQDASLQGWLAGSMRAGFGRNDLQPPADDRCPAVADAVAWFVYARASGSSLEVRMGRFRAAVVDARLPPTSIVDMRVGHGSRLVFQVPARWLAVADARFQGQPKSFLETMSMLRKLATLSMGLSLTATSALAATVTPEQVKALPLGTAFSGLPSGQFESGKPIPQNNGNEVRLIRTADGFIYFHADGGRGASEAQKVVCNNISKAGGKGNATINCDFAGGKQIRFEWLELDKIKYEYWFSMATKAGQTQHQQSQASATLTKKEPTRSGKIIPPGKYKVTFPDANWAPVTYTLEANGKFAEEGANARAGTWEELDGDFCHFDKQAHCYKLQPKGAGEKAIKLQYKKNDGSAGHMAVWTPI
jgi:hypothetical protein